MAVIDAQGESGVRISMIAHEVGVSATSIYHFYGDREGLIEAALAERYLRNITEVNDYIAIRLASCATSEDVRAVILDAIQLVAAPTRTRIRFNRAAVLGSLPTRPRLAASIAAMQLRQVEEFARILEIGKQRGVLRPDLDTLVASSWIACVTFGQILQEIIADHVDPEAFRSLTIRAIDEMLLARVAPA